MCYTIHLLILAATLKKANLLVILDAIHIYKTVANQCVPSYGHVLKYQLS